jgi:putative ABC transport system ATP-binding protein
MPHKKYSNSQALSSVIRFYRGDWKDIISILIYGITVGIFALIVPLAAQSLVNTVAFGTLLQPLIVLTGAVIVFLSISGVFKVAQFVIAEKLAQRLMVRVGLDLARWIPEIHYDNFKRNFGSEYINRFLEISTVQKATTFLLLDGSAVIFQLIFAVIFLGFYHPFFLIFSLCVAITLVLAVFIFGRSAIPTSMRESDDKYEILACIEDIAAAPQIFKSAVGQTTALNKMDKLLNQYLDSRRLHFRILVSQQIAVVLLQIIGSAMLLGVGGLLVIREQLSLGQLVAAEIIFTIILSNSDKLTKFLETFYDLVAGVAKLEMLATLPKEDVHSGELIPLIQEPLSIELKDIKYLQQDGDPLFDDLDLTVKPGQKIFIFGGNGSGKSVLADLIIGFKDPNQGIILFDGVARGDINLNSLRSAVAVVRGIEMIHGTLEENLKFGAPHATQKEIREVLSKVGLLDDIDSLPLGMRTIFKGDHAPFSVGQAERLMIARALLQKPRVIILDASLDVIDERSVHKTIEFILSDFCKATVIALTHERQFIQYFDAGYELLNGKLSRVK